MKSHKFETAVANGEVIGFKHADGWHSRTIGRVCECQKCYEADLIIRAQIREADEVQVEGEKL